MRSQSLGFDQENVLVFKVIGADIQSDYNTLKTKFLQNPFVTKVSQSSHTFDGSSSSGPAHLVGAPADDNHQLNYYQTGYDFLELMKLELVEGRFFSKEFPWIVLKHLS